MRVGNEQGLARGPEQRGILHRQEIVATETEGYRPSMHTARRTLAGAVRRAADPAFSGVPRPASPGARAAAMRCRWIRKFTLCGRNRLHRLKPLSTSMPSSSAGIPQFQHVEGAASMNTMPTPCNTTPPSVILSTMPH